MCGITAFCGKINALPYLLNGLEKLEYRGYDSSGISLLYQGKIITKKKKGRLAELKEEIKDLNLYGECGIAHTRWATHGEPSDINAHPHTNAKGTISVVHNGIIENAEALKLELTALGYTFVSKTDTEVASHLLDYYYDGNPLEAISKTAKRLKGSFALAVLFSDHQDDVYVTRKASPLVLGVGDNLTMAASDIPALLGQVNDFYLLDDDHFAVLKTSGITFYDEDLNEIIEEKLEVNVDEEVISKAGFATFMEKEIHEQPLALQKTMQDYIVDGKISIPQLASLENISAVYLFACGTAYHACLVASNYFESLTDLPCVTKTASEYRYSSLKLPKKALCIFVSQSGETADTLAALKRAKEEGAFTLAITNVSSSSLARMCDAALFTKAGIEISVASTKAYTTQVLLLLLIALALGNKQDEALLSSIINLPHYVDETLKNKQLYVDCTHYFKEATSAFYIGRQLDYTSAMEGALKIKEIAYIHAEAFAAGELKHGPIALIDGTTPVIALATQKNVIEKTVSNVEETIARDAHVILLTNDKNLVDKKQLHIIYLPEAHAFLYPIIAIIPLQILACNLAIVRGHDVDKPRNLAKSVTVE